MTTRQVAAAPLDRALSVRFALNWEVLAYAILLLIAFAVRFWDLGTQALHHDESIHAQWSWGLLQGNYNHSPVFHGPFYYHFQAAAFFLFGASDYTSRLTPAISGMVLVALPLLLRSRLGPAGTLAAVAFIGLSPTLVYFSRFMREDIYMAAFTMMMVVAMWRYLDDGRHRWLYLFAAGFVGNVLTKEGSFLVFAAYLIFLNIYLATQLAQASLRARSERLFRADLARELASSKTASPTPETETRLRAGSNLNTPFRRALLTVGFSPWAWALAALWPFLGRLRTRLDWPESLPRTGDLLVLLGTLCLPLLTPISRVLLLEPLGLLEEDRLSWQQSLQGTLATRDAIALVGLFAVSISIAAFAGLQWKPRVWGIIFAVGGFVYLTFMTSFWTNLSGLVSGPWGSLDYWYSQQHEYRGDQPWFYYFMLMPAYEFLPLALVIGGAWWAVVRGDAFSRFLVVWLFGIWLALSWGSEKMPWLNTHIALPCALLAAWTVQRAWHAWGGRADLRKSAPILASVAFLSAGALAVIAFMPSGTAYHLLRLAIVLGAVAAILFASWPLGRSAAGIVAVLAVVGALSFFSVRTMTAVTFERRDTPKDMLIYTQSSPQLKAVADHINDLADASGLGYGLPIAVDTSDSFAWPWAWYLRDYKAVTYTDFSNGPPTGDFQVMLVAANNAGRVQDYVASQATVQYGPPIRYAHRWWYEESYKYAMSVEGGRPCLASSGNCGPFRLATWKKIGSGVFGGGWLNAWASYWRDHDPGRAPGAINAFAFLPANFDTETGKLAARPVEPPAPGTDDEGRPMFGGTGSLPGQFFSPVDIQVDEEGNLYVIDSATKKLQRFDSQGNLLNSVDIRISPSNTNEQAQPWGLAIGPNGEVVVADTFGWRVRVFDRNLQAIGTFGTPPTGDPEPAPEQLFGPRDAAFDLDGNIWVTDTGHDRIQVFTLSGQFVRSVGTSGAGSGQFDEPVGIAIGPDGVVYVADMYNSRVQVLNPDGSFRSEFRVEGSGGLEVSDKPYITLLRDGRIAVSLPSAALVRIYNPDGTVSGTINPTGQPLFLPYGMAETADGKLWIVEGGAARVRLFDIP